jgi:hypothetical protein
MSNSESVDREKWEVEKSFRERELKLRETEVEISRQQSRSSQWRDPLVLAILAATIAATGNAIIAIVNGNLQRELEDQKYEQARILEVIKVGNPEKAAENLKFLLKAGLIRNELQASALRKFLNEREPGTGPTLPAASINSTSGSSDKIQSEKAAAAIMDNLKRQQYTFVWDHQVSEFFKQRTDKEQFINVYSSSRAFLGELLNTQLISTDVSSYDPSTQYEGVIHAITFINTYSAGIFFERIVLLKEKDGTFRLSGFWISAKTPSN